MGFLIDQFKQFEIRHSSNVSLLATINTHCHTSDKYWRLLDETEAYVTAVLIYPSKRIA